jgi:hypothetical protein
MKIKKHIKTKFDSFLIEEVDSDPFYSHRLRMEKGVRPKYKSGMIAIRFQDDEKISDKKYPEVDEETGEYRVNYQELFSNIETNDFVRYFENKYKIKRSNYRSGTSDYFIYFNCRPGEEEEKIKEVAKDKVVKVVDYVDARGIENKDKLEDISRDLLEIVDEYGDENTKAVEGKIRDIIKRLQNLL